MTSRPNFGLDLTNERTFFFLVFAFFAVTLLVLYVLVRSPFGRSLEGIRERELRMQILGYNTWLHKYIAFIIAGAVGGLSGVLWAHTNGLVSPDTVVLTTSVDALLMVVLGGAGTLVGGAIGSAIVFGLREYLSTLVPWWQYVLGGVYVLTILYLPMGLMGLPAAHSSVAEHALEIGGRTRLGARPVLKQSVSNTEGVKIMTRQIRRRVGVSLVGACLALAAGLAPAAAQQNCASASSRR